MEAWTEEQEKAYKEREQWFLNRIGKRVYRGATSCKCESCKRITGEGLIIYDDDHARYLHEIEAMYNADGHYLKYTDEKI